MSFTCSSKLHKLFIRVGFYRLPGHRRHKCPSNGSNRRSQRSQNVLGPSAEIGLTVHEESRVLGLLGYEANTGSVALM